jgi:hypothetical protein
MPLFNTPKLSIKVFLLDSIMKRFASVGDARPASAAAARRYRRYGYVFTLLVGRKQDCLEYCDF